MISFLDHDCAELSASTFFSHTQRAQNGKFIQMQKEAAWSGSQLLRSTGKIEFYCFPKSEGPSQANAVTEKGKGYSRRGMKGARQSSKRETTFYFKQKLILKSYLQTFTRVNCKKWFVVCSDWLQYNYFTWFWTSSRNEFSLHLVNSEKK